MQILGALALGLGIWVAVDKGSVINVLSRVPGKAALTADEISKVVESTSWLQMAAYATIALGMLVYNVTKVYRNLGTFCCVCTNFTFWWCGKHPSCSVNL